MKKIITQLFLISVLLLAGCDNSEHVFIEGEQTISQEQIQMETQSPDETKSEGVPVIQVSGSELEPETDLSLVNENGLRMVSDGKHIYYSTFSYNNPEVLGLRRINLTLDKEVILYDGDCIGLCLNSGYIYFYSVANERIMRMKTDGSEITDVYMPSKEISGMAIFDNCLYFTTDMSLYRLPLDSSSEQAVLVTNNVFINFVINENGLFYVGYSSTNSGGLDLFYLPNEDVKSVVQGAELSAVCLAEDVDSDFTWANDKIYYLKEIPGSNIEDEYIYDYELLCITPSGDVSKTGITGSIEYLCSASDELYYTKYQSVSAGEPFDDYKGNQPYCFSISNNTEETIFTNVENMSAQLCGIGGGYIWFSSYSYDTNANINYWSSVHENECINFDEIRSEVSRNENIGDFIEPYGPGTSMLYLSSDELSACFRLVRMDGTTEFIKFLEPYAEISVSFPCGRYTLKTAEGDKWISDDEAFGASGNYSTTDIFNFASGGAYEISSGSRGDFRNDSASGFLG